MSRDEKLIAKILSGLADSHISFDELCNLLRRMKFDERIHEYAAATIFYGVKA